MNFDTTVILVWIGALLFATTTIYGLWWSLFWDRARGQRRCPTCWHLVQHRFPFRCNECGYFTLFENNLLSTRRRYGWACVALLSLITGTIWLRDQLSTRSWWSLFPDRMVIAMLPLADDGETFREIPPYLVNRVSREEMSAPNRLRLLSQCASGDSWAPPSSENWMQKYASIVDKIEQTASLTKDTPESLIALETALNTMPPLIRFDVPANWNSVDPLVVVANVRDWWPEQSTIKLRVSAFNGIQMSTPALERLTHQHLERTNSGGAHSTMFTIDLGVLAVGHHSGEIVIEWKSTLPETAKATNTPHAHGYIAIPISTNVLATTQSLAPINTHEIDALVQEAFEPGLMRWSTGQVRHAFSYQPYKTSSLDLNSVAFGMIVEALEDGVPRRRLNVWWRGGRGGSRSGFEIEVEDQIALDRAAVDAHWTMRIRGNESLARRVAGLYSQEQVTTWWSGRVEFPLAINDFKDDLSSRATMRAWQWIQDANSSNNEK
jgi:hypothetical protein